MAASKSWIALPLAAALALALAGASGSQTMPDPGPDLGHGQAIAQEKCAACHAVGMTGDSPLPEAPRFRDLHERFDVADLQEALAEGIVVGHGPMPAWALSATDIRDLVGYLKSLESAA